MEITVGELAKRAGVTRRTIRYYVEIGLLPPPKGAGKAALYSEEHLDRLARIRRLQTARLSLEEIRDALAGKSPTGGASMMLADAAAVEPGPYLPADRSSAAEYLARVREGEAALQTHALRAVGEPRPDFDAEQWLRVSLSEDVELHVRRRASRTPRWLNRLIKEARRVIDEEKEEA